MKILRMFNVAETAVIKPSSNRARKGKKEKFIYRIRQRRRKNQ